MVIDALGLDEFLTESELLSRRDLIAPDARTGGELHVGVACGRPLLYPVPCGGLPDHLRGRAQVTGVRHAGIIIAFDLDAPPPGHRYASARFTVELADERVIAAVVHPDGGRLGLRYEDGRIEAGSPLAEEVRVAAAARPGLLYRLGVRTERPAAWTSGTQSSRFGWHYTDRRSDPILPRTYAVHALLELPSDATLNTVAGTLSAEVDLAGRVRRRATMAVRVPFAEPLPVSGPGPVAAVRLCVAADVAGYSARGAAAAERAQNDLVALMAAARRRAGIADSQVSPQAQGDGQFTVLPAGIDESSVIPALIESLCAGLAARNATAGPDRMRLRVALHRGLVKEAGNGWVGRAAIAVHRILDSPPLRAALAASPDADFALGLPDMLYADVIAQFTGPPDPAAFRPVTVDLPAKGFLERAWVYVP